MTAPAPPRPHRRARTQLVLGLAPLLVACAGVLVVLAVRLGDAQAPLAAATGTATATVVEAGRDAGRRGVSVRFADADGRQRAGELVFRDRVQGTAGAELPVRYDPRSPADDTAVFADGDAAHRAVQDVLFGIAAVAFVAVLATLLTLLRLVTRARLRRAPAAEATATRVVVREGLLVRSWLELGTAAGTWWVPVYWSPELAALPPVGRIELRGAPGRDRLVLPVVDGAEVWPSGRVRARPPRGERRTAVPGPDEPAVRWSRQVRGDVLPAVAAPLLGLAWAYVDGSGVAGFAVATIVAAVVLFWLAALLGSDPAPPPR
jgi:hypothetical protein